MKRTTERPGLEPVQRRPTSPENLRNMHEGRGAAQLLMLQRTHGNRYVQRVLSAALGADESDRVSTEVEQAILQPRAPGQPLETGVRRHIEAGFGVDFGGVRVHTDERADTLNQALSARAFTVGQDIFFRRSEFNPSSAAGRELLAHELAHVVQQSGTAGLRPPGQGSDTRRSVFAAGPSLQAKLSMSSPGDREEQAADDAARAFVNWDAGAIDDTHGSTRAKVRPDRMDASTMTLRKAEQNPDRTGVSFELRGAVPSASPAFDTVPYPLNENELHVFAWLRHHKEEIAAAEITYGVDRRAIAGAIAWEALENVKDRSLRAIGPGKVHYKTFPWEREPTTLLQTQEAGYLPALDTAQVEAFLATPKGSITAIAAIMRADADAIASYYPSIYRDPGMLTTLYNAWTLEGVRRLTKAKLSGARAEPIPLLVPNEMGTWTNNHHLFLEAAVGASLLAPERRPEPVTVATPSHIQRSMAVLQQCSRVPSLQLAAAPAVPLARKYGDEYRRYAERLHKAMVGWGTDEEAIFEVLEKIQGRPMALEYIDEAYRNLYATSLVDDLRDEMSGSELSYALDLLGKGPARSNPTRSEDGALNEYDAAAQRLVRAMAGLGTDEEAIYASLLPFAGAFGRIAQLKEAYRRKAKAASLDALEDDLRSEMSGAELQHALSLLTAPRKPDEGMAALLLEEARRGTTATIPGDRCTLASLRRYVRAFLDYYFLEGLLEGVARLEADPSKNKEELQVTRKLLREKLTGLLGGLSSVVLTGGPKTGQEMFSILQHPHVLGHERASELYALWQIYASMPADESRTGATAALQTRGKYHKVVRGETIAKIAQSYAVSAEAIKQANVSKLKPSADSAEPWFTVGEVIDIPGGPPSLAARVRAPTTQAANIKDALWQEILPPGAVIQTWRTVDDAQLACCAARENAFGACDQEAFAANRCNCGHSFIFVEYVYAETARPPAKNPQSWALYGGSGTPLNTSGVRASSSRSSLETIRNLVLVGLRIIDQYGYLIIFRDARDNAVLSGRTALARWLGASEVWYASRLS